MVNNKIEMHDRNGKSKVLISLSLFFFYQNPEKTNAYAHILNINQNEII